MSLLTTSHYSTTNHATSHYSIQRNNRICHVLLQHNTSCYSILRNARECYQKRRISSIVYTLRKAIYLCNNNKNHTVLKLYFHLGCDNYEDNTKSWDIFILGVIIVVITLILKYQYSSWSKNEDLLFCV